MSNTLHVRLFGVMALPSVTVTLLIDNNFAGLILPNLFRIVKTSDFSQIPVIARLWRGNMCNSFNNSSHHELRNEAMSFVPGMCSLSSKFLSTI